MVEHEAPQDAAKDVGRALALGALDAINLFAPGVGSGLSAVVGTVWPERRVERIREFAADLARDFETYVIEQEITLAEIQELASDPYREEIIRRAAEAAVRTADNAHRQRCRAALLNGLSSDVDTTLALRFTQFLDELTPAHFELLASIDEAEKRGRRPLDVARETELSDEVLTWLMGDLVRRDLVYRTSIIDGNAAGREDMEPPDLEAVFLDAQPSGLGNRLIEHVSLPLKAAP